MPALDVDDGQPSRTQHRTRLLEELVAVVFGIDQVEIGFA
jgi:hypothetical protein